MAGTRRLTDAQLASATLETEDPMAVERVTLARPDPDLKPQILFEFHRATTDERVWCCHCQAHRPWNGFVIENETGNRYLIGSTCGPKYYELSFAQARRQHEELKQRKGLKLRHDVMIAAVEETLAAIHDILHSDGLRALDAVKARFSKYGGDAYFRLSSIALRGGLLTESVKVRDYAAEASRPADFPDDSPLYTFQEQALGPIAGHALVTSSGDCRDCLLDLKRVLLELGKSRCDDTDLLSTTAFQRLVRRAEDAFERAYASIIATRDAPSFFAEAHLERLARWSEQFSSFDLHARDQGLEIVLRSGSPLLVERIASINIPDLPALGGVVILSA
jgi:hypothetical protein